MATSSPLGPLAAEMWLASAFCAALVLAVVAPARSRAHQQSSDPQHIHTGATSRLGGVAVVLGFAVAVFIASARQHVPAHAILPLLLAALPVQLVGLWEDLTHRVSPRRRIYAAVVSAILASVFAEGIISRLDLPVADALLAYLPFALLLTWFMVVGACNAFNIIDGTNGLAGGSSVLMFAGMAIIAWNVGDSVVLAQTAAIIGALVAFLVWNYPKGRIFLGDAGAYFIGFMYAQLSVQLVARNPGVSAWFVIALAAYPIVEMVYSIYRRKVVEHTAATQPDIRHLHSLLYRNLLRSGMRPPSEERRLNEVVVPYAGPERRQPQRRANARVAPRLWMHGVLCFSVAVLFYNQTPVLIAFVLAYGIFYVASYRSAERLYDESGMVSVARRVPPRRAFGPRQKHQDG